MENKQKMPINKLNKGKLEWEKVLYMDQYIKISENVKGDISKKDQKDKKIAEAAKIKEIKDKLSKISEGDTKQETIYKDSSIEILG